MFCQLQGIFNFSVTFLLFTGRVFKTIKLSFLLSLEIITYVSLSFHKKNTYIHSSVSHLLKNKAQATMSCSFKTGPVLLGTQPQGWCILCMVYSDDVHRNMHAAAKTIDCIQLRQGVLVLAWGQWADLRVPHLKSKICAHRIWLKLKDFS